MQINKIQNPKQIEFRSFDHLTSEITSDLTGSIDRHLPLKFWEIDLIFKCPVVGTCLDMSEQKQILKKAGISLKKKNPYEIHETILRSSGSETPLSRKIDCRLNRKFKREITAFFDLEEDELMQIWKSRVKNGEIKGLLWVAATRADLSIESKRFLFGNIHMEMHLNAVENRKVRQQLSYLQDKNQELAQRLKEESGVRRILKKENENLERDQTELSRQYAFLENENLSIEKELSILRGNTGILDLETENQQLRDELGNLSGEIGDYQQRLETLRIQNNKLLSKLESQRELNDHLKKETERIITRISALNRCDETCPSFDLCRKRILIVGGINRMESIYRQLIEDNGGIFEYHDGHIKGGKKALENRIMRADIVLCPVNINSHNACSVVKKMGKKHRKSVQMLAGSGLGVISQALSECQEGISTQ
ncbi:MAG: hypothetical protein SRB2_04023 [Desulfobacteraceae bacterium Eth-SRB2]|nr:MAG: hypothetical protein SRB2_04023 [Desulfobacteraceae bacterium Eth-SRB2]